MLLGLSFCSFPGGLFLKCCAILKETEPEPHIPSVYALCEVDADSTKSLMSSGLSLDAILNGRRSVRWITDFQEALTHRNWFREGLDYEGAELDHYARHCGQPRSQHSVTVGWDYHGCGFCGWLAKHSLILFSAVFPRLQVMWDL